MGLQYLLRIFKNYFADRGKGYTLVTSFKKLAVVALFKCLYMAADSWLRKMEPLGSLGKAVNLDYCTKGL